MSVAVLRDIAVYFGFVDETAESRASREAALLETSSARLLLSAVLGVLVAGAIVGLVRCLLDGDGVTLARLIEKGWLAAAVVAPRTWAWRFGTAAASSEMTSRRSARARPRGRVCSAQAVTPALCAAGADLSLVAAC